MNSFQQHLLLQSKILFRQKILSIICIGSMLFLLIPMHFTRSFAYEKPIEIVLAEKTVKINGLPMRLKIPILEIDAQIEYVGFAADGSMDAPKDINNVAWLKSGPRPGDAGSAVIAGHRGWLDGKPAIFNKLQNLKNGDMFYIEDDTAILIPFVIKDNKIYDPEEKVDDVFNNKEGNHLNLITCAGDWNDDKKVYDKRLVIFAEALRDF